MNVTNAIFPTSAQMMAFVGHAEDEPFVMLNMLKFRDKAEYADGTGAGLTGREAYQLYGAGVQACVAAVGGQVFFSANVTELLLGQVDDLWDMIALAEYPNREAMRKMVASPEYQAIEKHRIAGLAGQLNIRTQAIMARSPKA